MSCVVVVLLCQNFVNLAGSNLNPLYAGAHWVSGCGAQAGIILVIILVIIVNIIGVIGGATSSSSLLSRSGPHIPRVWSRALADLVPPGVLAPCAAAGGRDADGWLDAVPAQLLRLLGTHGASLPRDVTGHLSLPIGHLA
jgi:hypothetical protein